MAAVVVIGVSRIISISSWSSGDYGLQDYGLVRIADCGRISYLRGLQDYGLF